MPAYIDITLQDRINVQYPRCKLQSLEMKCCSTMEKLKSALGEHLQNGLPTAEILEKTISFLTLKKVAVLHSGYSRCSRDVLRLFPSTDEDLEELFSEE